MAWSICTAEGDPGGGLPPGESVGDILFWDGSEWVVNGEGEPDAGDILVWDGTEWVPTPIGGPGGGLPPATSPGDILFSPDGASWAPNAQGTPDVNDTLIWDGSTWQPGSILLNGSLKYMSQANWFVDSVNGDDDNDGSQATNAPNDVGPLKTLVELQRRFEGRISLLTHVITLAGTFPTEVLGLRATFMGTVLVTAAATLVATGVVSAFVALAAPATDAKLTDTTTPTVWTTRVGMQVRITSGASSGAVATVLKDLGSNQARVSQFTNPATFAAAVPANGSAFAIESFDVVIGGVQADLLGKGFVTLENVSIAQTGGTSSFVRAGGGTNNAFTFRSCRFNTVQFSLGMGSACNIIGCSNTSTAQMFLGRQSTCVLVGHAAFANLNLDGPYVLFAATATCVQAARVLVDAGGAIDLAATLAIFDLTGTNPCIDVLPNSAVNATATAMGINNTTTGVGIRCRTGATYTHSAAGNAPTVVGAGGETSIGGVVTTYAVIAAAPQSCIMNANNGAIIGLRAA